MSVRQGDVKRAMGLCIVSMIDTAGVYAEGHARLYKNQIGNDGVLGPAFCDVLRGLKELLNGETSDLDCGMMDRRINAIAKNSACVDENGDIAS